MATKNPLTGRFSRKRIVHALIHEQGGELTYDQLPLADDAIMDNLKNRGFLQTESPTYINFTKEIKPGRYELHEVSARAGATVTRVEVPTDEPTVTREICIFGTKVKVEESKALHRLITAADDVYNMLDNNWLMGLFNVKPQVLTLVIVGIFSIAFGYMLAKSF